MISAKEAANVVKKKYPDVFPKSVIDYDSKMYIVEAPKFENEPDFNDPFYSVTKDGSKVARFNPIMNDLDKFIEASTSRSITL